MKNRGQVTLLESSNKYGCLLFCCGSKLNVVLNQDMLKFVQDGGSATHQIKFEGIIEFLQIDKEHVFVQYRQEETSNLERLELTEVVTGKVVSRQNVKVEILNKNAIMRSQVRQLSICKDRAVITVHWGYDQDHKYGVELVDLMANETIAKFEGLNSAVFQDQEGEFIIAANDGHKDQILLLDAGNLQTVNAIDLTFPGLHEDIQVDKFRIFQILMLPSSNLIAFGSYFREESNLNDEMGASMMFWIGNRLKKTSTLEGFVQQEKVKAFFWNDLDHQNDRIIPSIKLDYVQHNGEIMVTAMMNHCDTPFLFKIKDNNLEECYEYTSMNKPLVVRPKGPDGFAMESIETLGTCLGVTLFKSKIAGAPEKLEVMLTDEDEELFYPPILFLMQLDGSVKFWQMFYGKWKEADLLTQPEPSVQKQKMPVQQPEPSVQKQKMPVEPQKQSFAEPIQKWKMPDQLPRQSFEAPIQKIEPQQQENAGSGTQRNFLGVIPEENFLDEPDLSKLNFSIPCEESKISTFNQKPSTQVKILQPLQKQEMAPPPAKVEPPKPKLPEGCILAIEYHERMKDIYNKHVVSNMNKIKDSFPTFKKILSDPNLIAAMKDLRTSDSFDFDSLIQTSKQMLELTKFKQILKKLRREVLVGGKGEIERLQLLCIEFDEFLKQSKFDPNDAKLLLEIWQNGQRQIQSFDAIRNRVETTTDIKERFTLALNENLSQSEIASGGFPAEPADPFTVKQLQAAGIYRKSPDIKKISTDVWINENIKHEEETFNALQNRLEYLTNRAMMPKASQIKPSTSKYGDFGSEEEDLSEEAKTAETPIKSVTRNLERRKMFQQQLVGHFQEPLKCQLTVVEQVVVQKQNLSASAEFKKIVPQNLNIGDLRGTNQAQQAELDRATANITKFFNAEDVIKSRTERKQFISSLDANLLTSPQGTPTVGTQPALNNQSSILSQTTTHLNEIPTHQLKGCDSLQKQQSSLQQQSSLLKQQSSQQALLSFGEKSKIPSVTESKINVKPFTEENDILKQPSVILSKSPFSLALAPTDQIAPVAPSSPKIDVKPVDAKPMQPAPMKLDIAKSNFSLFGQGSQLIPASVAPIDSNTGFGKAFGFTDAAAIAKQTKETVKQPMGFGQTFTASQPGAPATSNKPPLMSFTSQPNTQFGTGNKPNFSAQGGLFGQPSAASGFGQQPATGFAQQAATSGFGQQPATGFAQPSPASGFGQPPATGFGQPSAAFGFGQQPSTGFAQPLPTGFGQSASPGFGQFGGLAPQGGNQAGSLMNKPRK